MKIEDYNMNISQILGKNKNFFKLAGLSGALAVIIGAYGFHGKYKYLY